jgi:hypothetical protein
MHKDPVEPPLPKKKKWMGEQGFQFSPTWLMTNTPHPANMTTVQQGPPRPGMNKKKEMWRRKVSWDFTFRQHG